MIKYLWKTWWNEYQTCLQLVPFRDHKRQYIILDYFSHNSLADRASDVFKPYIDLESLLVSIKQSWEVLDLSFLWVAS